jgi:hypothetical protein
MKVQTSYVSSNMTPSYSFLPYLVLYLEIIDVIITKIPKHSSGCFAIKVKTVVATSRIPFGSSCFDSAID